MILAVAAITSCSKEDVVNSIVGDAISFGNVFIENSTKAADPTFTASNLKEFYVYGTVTGMNGNGATASIYTANKVVKGDGIWNADVERYWVPTSKYSFAAVTGVAENEVDVTLTDGLPSSIKYDVTSQTDLLYATAAAATDEIGAPSGDGIVETAGGVKTVGFSFEHLLALVQFTFTNGFPDESDVELTVTDIKITNAAKSAEYTVGNNGGWDDLNLQGNTAILDFGATEDIADNGNFGTSSNKCVVIPGTQTFDITFTVNHNKGGEPTEKTMTTGEITLSPGYSYNFITELNASNVEGVEPITFVITTNEGWSDENHEVDHRKF